MEMSSKQYDLILNAANMSKAINFHPSTQLDTFDNAKNI